MIYGKFFRYMPALTLAFALMFCAAPGHSQGGAPSAGNLFIKAMMEKDQEGMKNLIATRTEEFPPEVQAMIQYAMSEDAKPEEADFLFNVAGTISMMYGEQTGDKRLLEAVKVNYNNLKARRGEGVLSPEAVDKVKKELSELGDGEWRVQTMKLNDNGDLIVEIDVKEPQGGGAGFTPHIDFKKSKEAVALIKKNLPGVKKGKVSWTSMGVGLKTAFLDQP